MRHIQSIRPSGGVIGSSQNPLTYTTQRQTSMPPAFFFCSRFVLSSVLLCPDCPGFCFCPYSTSHTAQTSILPAEFCFLFCLCTLSVLLFSWLSWLCLLSLLYNTNNTNIHAPGGIRTRNPSKRSAADFRLSPLSHWDSNPQPQQAIGLRPSP